MDTPKTLMEAVRYFAEPSVAETYMRSIKWPDGKIAQAEITVNVHERYTA